MKEFNEGDIVIYQWIHYINSESHHTRQKEGRCIRFVKHRFTSNQYCLVKFPKNKRNSRLSLKRLFHKYDNRANINFDMEN
jgi:hypothetical protein